MIKVQTNIGGTVYFDTMQAAQKYCNTYGGIITGGATQSTRTENPSTFTMKNGEPAFYSWATCYQRPW